MQAATGEEQQQQQQQQTPFSSSLVGVLLDGGVSSYDEAIRLLDAGADVNQTNEWGDTPLHAAALKGQYLAVTTLLDKGANPNAQNKAGSTPLHKAAVGNHLFIAKALIQKGARTDLENHAGYTADFYTTNIKTKQHLLGSNCVTETFFVPKSRHGNVIGKSGQNRKKIVAKSGVVDLVLPRPDDNAEDLTIIGSASAVARCKALLSELINTNPKTQKSSDAKPGAQRRDGREKWPHQHSFDVEKQHHGRIIGLRGKNIKKIEDETGVRIAVPDNNDPSVTITLYARDASGIDKAMERIDRILEGANDYQWGSRQ